MILRAPPGPLVGAGRVRVDAARAVAKLRAFRLAEPAAWILEAIRAAVAGAATELELVADSDDLWLRWAGPAWAAEELSGLLDDLVSPEEEEHGYRRRLLGSAVNSALALEPRWLELLAADAGGARGVRFVPDQIAQSGRSGEVMLRSPQAVTAPSLPPLASGAPCAMQLHLCLATGLRTLWRAVLGQELSELALARAACAELTVPMTIGGAPVQAPHDLLRLPLGQGLTGFVALVEPSSASATSEDAWLRVAELGVAIARLEWEGARLVALPWLRGAAPPVRLYLDAPRVATNASRSAVDEQAPLLRAAKERGEALVGALVDLLADQLASAPSPRLRECAFALLAQAAGGADWSEAVARVAPPLGAVARLPLLRNAVGELRPIAGRWARPVYRGARPLPQALAPWLETLAWIPPGDPAERLLRGTDGHARAANEIIKRAQRARAAREAFLAQPESSQRVTSHGEGATFALGGASAPSAVPDEAFAGLAGEVRVVAEGGVARLALLYRGRLLETIVGESELTYDAVLDSSEVTPDLACRSAERDAAFERVERAARLGAVRAVEQWCARDLPEGTAPSGPFGARLAAAVRRALVVASTERLRMPLGLPLVQAKAWPTVEGGWLSLAEVRALRVIAAVEVRQIRVDLPPGRQVLRVERSELVALAALAVRTEVVSYGPFAALLPRDPAAVAAQRHAEQGASVTLLVREPHRAGAISPGPHGELSLMHRGIVLRTETRAGVHVACRVTVASEELVPGVSWRTVLAGEERATEGLERWEQALANALVAALAGEEVADLRFHKPPRTRAEATEVLATALAAFPPAQLDALVGDERRVALRAMPLFSVSTRPEPVSAELLAEWFAHGELLYSTPERAEELDGPILLGELAEARLASWLTRLPLASASARHMAAVRAEQLQRRLDHHLAARTQDLALPAESFAVSLSPPWRGVLGAAVVDGRPRITLEVWCLARPAFVLTVRCELPLLAAVDLDPSAFNDTWTDVHDDVREALLVELELTAERWLRAMITERPAELIGVEPARRVLEAWLESQGQARVAPVTGQVPELVQLVLSASAWPTIQGGFTSLDGARHEGVVRTARWAELWLPPAEGAAAHSLDLPVLMLPATVGDRESWHQILQALQVQAREVTGAVVVMQAARRARQDGAARFVAALGEPTRRELFGGAGATPAREPPSTVEVSAGREALVQAGLLGGSSPPSGAAARPSLPPAPPGLLRMAVRGLAAGYGEAPVRAHPLARLATLVAERLRALCGRVLAFARFVIVEDRATPVVRISGDLLELAGQAPELARLAQLLARDAAAAEPGVVALLAYVASELNRAHTAVTDVHEQHILLELLRNEPGQGAPLRPAR